MMPMGIERCGFLASSPVQTQEARCASLHSTVWGKYPQRMSQSRDFPWQQSTGEHQAGAVGEEGSLAMLLHWQKGRNSLAAWACSPPGHASPSTPPAVPSPYRAY